MSDTNPQLDPREVWEQLAADWHIQVGEEGDANRRLNSDPVLWHFVGEVRGKTVLDAGCGTGYLARQLSARGARVTGVDFSEKMIDIARAQAATKELSITFTVDSCTTLASQPDAAYDLLIANYVLMDVDDLESAVAAFHRVLRPNGVAVLVFSHPCFPADFATDDAAGRHYHWPFSYFARRQIVSPPWGHFTHDFLWFHRPLSDYWKAFKHAGFLVDDFEEPRLTPDRYHLAEDARRLHAATTKPFSVAFRLIKPGE